MNIEIIQEPISSVRFHSHKKELVDLDFLFKEANRYYGRFLLEKNITPTFDFSKRYDQKLYMNGLIIEICEWIKNRDSNYGVHFYWNSSRDDQFRNRLAKKLGTTFRFPVWESSEPLESFVKKIESKECGTITGLEVFLNAEKSTKTFKSIKKHLEKSGLVYLNSTYFNDLNNKLLLFL